MQAPPYGSQCHRAFRNIARDARKLKLRAATDPAATPPKMLRGPVPAQAIHIQKTPILISAPTPVTRMYGIQLPRPAVDLKVKRRFSPQVTVAAKTNADMREGSGVSEVSCVKSNVHPASTTKPTAPTMQNRRKAPDIESTSGQVKRDLQIGEPLEFLPSSRHGFEDDSGRQRKGCQDHDPGRQNRRREPGH